MVKYNIEELRLRRKRNLVKIMYTQSKNIENLKATSVERALRSGNKMQMKNDFTNITKVYNSPLYRRIRPWVGGSPCHMSILRNDNVALSDLRKPHVTLSNLTLCCAMIWEFHKIEKDLGYLEGKL